MRSYLTSRIPSPAGRALEINGHVFGAVTIAGMAALLFVTARYNQTAVVVLLGFGLATIAVSRVWSALALRNVSFSRVLNTRALFPDEELRAETRVSNDKMLPMPWVEAIQQLPGGFHSDAPIETDYNGQFRLTRSFSLPWYSRITWTERLTAVQRGCYAVPPLFVSSGDILGLYPRAITSDATEEITVYPRLYPVHHLSTQRTDASGEQVGIATLQEDPTRMRGIRDYAPGDSLRRVHWKATARHSDLKVKLFEPAAVSRLQLALATDETLAASADAFELAVSAIASIGRFCIERQQQIGFSSNARLGDSGIDAHLAAGGGNEHLVALLEVLARVKASPARAFPLFAQHLRRLAFERTALVVVTGRLEGLGLRTYEHLAGISANFRVLSVDTVSKRPHVSFPCTFVSSPDDLLVIGGGRIV